ncbi:caskin-1 [Hydra vulgaris]|uniref:caskin-1 n=1 Tax=Hydra vulgaris TaxID=6087 RepID=UPI0002B48A5A|nr:caskin-1 [Hydra vulgaris]
MVKESDLMLAVKNNDGQRVRKYLHKFHKSGKKSLEKKLGINSTDSDGFTPLHHAALQGNVDILMAIIEMGGDPNGKDNKGMTPLHMASWAGKDEAVKCLLENKALPNLASFSGDTALHLAAQHGYSGCAKLLLASNADGTFRNRLLETPLDLACQYGHTQVVKQLLTNEMVTSVLLSPTNSSKSPLHLSAKSGHDDIVSLLLQHGVHVDDCSVEGTALHMAALYGKTEVARLLLKAGASVFKTNDKGLMPLDLVNKFTTSRAALEIKQMLREAAGEHIVYAKAVSDYSNQYDETSISFKCGETIAVLQRNHDGRWKGFVVGSKEEEIGFFPAMAVHVISERAISGCSLSPSTPSKSSRNSKTAPSSPVTPTKKHVGVVNIGNFDVLTLAKANTECSTPVIKQTAGGNVLTHLNSFKSNRSIEKQTSSDETNQPPLSPKLYKANLSPEKPLSPSLRQSKSMNGHTSRMNSDEIKRFRARVYSSGSPRPDNLKRLNHVSNPKSLYSSIEIPPGTSPLVHIPASDTVYTDVCHIVCNDSPKEVTKNNMSPSLNNISKENNSESPVIKSNQIKYFKSKDHNLVCNYEDMSGCFSPPAQDFHLRPSQIVPTSDYGSMCTTSSSSLEINDHQANHDELTDRIQYPSNKFYEKIHSFANGHEKSYNDCYDGGRTSTTNSSFSPSPPLNYRVNSNYENQDDTYYSNQNNDKEPEPSNNAEKQVLDWLNELKLTYYYDHFITNGFDMTSIHAITPEDLNSLEIMKTGHRKKLLSEIARLPANNLLPNEKPENVREWLSNLNLLQYESNFVEGGFDDIDFIKDLDKSDLDMIDIKTIGHQKKLLMAVQRLHDLELTDILDRAVEANPIRNSSFRSDTSKTSGYINNLNNNKMSPSIDDLPPPPPPSSIQENNIQRIPHTSKKPVPAPIPKPKPSVKPINETINNSVDAIVNLRKGSVNSLPGELQGDQSEEVTSSKSRDLFKQMERRTSSAEQMTSPPSTMVRTSSIANSNIRKNSDITSAPPIVPPKQSVKKVPPPAPPKRSSSVSSNELPASQPFEPVLERVVSPPPVSETSPKMPSFTPPPPPRKIISAQTSSLPAPCLDLPLPPPELISPPNDEIEEPPTLKKKGDRGFEETDDILADIMADIDDFSAQLDSMF